MRGWPRLWVAVAIVILWVIAYWIMGAIDAVRGSEIDPGDAAAIEAPADEPPPPPRTWSPAEAAAVADADAAAHPELVALGLRYLWIPGGAPADHWATILTINSTLVPKRFPLLVPGEVIAGGRLQRVVLGRLASNADDVARNVALWERLAEREPFFSTRVIAPATGETPEIVTVTPALHTGAAHAQLAARVDSVVPIVRADYFCEQMLTTLAGGLYYVATDVIPGETTLADYLAARGISRERVAALTSDERAALFRSGVTGMGRIIEVIPGESARPSASVGYGTITLDQNRDSYLATAGQPMRNLITFQPDGFEVITVRPSGLLDYAAFDGAGLAVRAVPDNITSDHEIPAGVPGGQALEPGISCIRCHGPDDGYRPFVNSVDHLVGAAGFDLFGDLSGLATRDPQLARLAGLYGGRLKKPVDRLRDDYADAVFRLTGETVPAVHAATAELFGRYRYQPVDAATACRELGLAVVDHAGNELDPVAVFSSGVGVLAFDATGIAPEDPMILAIRRGQAINRADWNAVFVDAANRILLGRLLFGWSLARL